MSGNHNEFQLFQEIIKRSVGQTWEEARREWQLESVSRSGEARTCLCGHYPIVELCYLRNAVNKNLACVGNHCVTKFMEIDSNSIFDGLARIKKDPFKAANQAVIDYAWNWLDGYQRDFCLRVKRKRKLTENQLNFRYKLNSYILRKSEAYAR